MNIINTLSTPEGTELSLVEFNKGEKLYLENPQHMELKEFISYLYTSRTSQRQVIVFKITTLVLLDQFKHVHKKDRCQRLLWARRPVPDEIPQISTPILWPKAQAALGNKGIRPTFAPPSFKYVIIYDNEKAISAFKETGAKGWVIDSAVLDGYINELPKIESTGVIKEMWIIYYKSGSLQFAWDNLPRNSVDIEKIIEISYDVGSLLVTKMAIPNSTYIPTYAIYSKKTMAAVYVNGRLPYKMRPPESRNL